MIKVPGRDHGHGNIHSLSVSSSPSAPSSLTRLHWPRLNPVLRGLKSPAEALHPAASIAFGPPSPTTEIRPATGCR